MYNICDYSYYDVVIIGSGCSGLMSAYTLSKKDINFSLIDCGYDIETRDHNNPVDITTGIGGAGLFSDGKFSFFPLGKIWEYPSEILKYSCDDLQEVLKTINIDMPEKKENYDIDVSDWNLKKYDVCHVSLERRIKLINLKIKL